jgi:CelD/BcsL family acetyltransferase involved in cellulose biosynthesis
MQVQHIDNAVDLDSLREEWDALLESSPSNNIFLTWEWLRTWWKYLAERRKLQVVALRHGGELIALAPLGVRPPSIRRLFPFGSIDFLGSGTAGSDYLDLIVRQGWEEDAVSALSRTLSANRMLEFSRVRADGPTLDLARSLQQSGWTAEIAKSEVCPYINLRGHSWTSYLASLGSEHRYSVRRKRNTLATQFDVAFERVEDPLERGPALRLLMDLHRKRWNGCGESDAFHTESHVQFHDEFTARAMRRGWLRLYVLRLNAKPVSAIYGLRYGPTFYFFQSGFDPQYARNSVGVVAMALSIEEAIKEGAAEYDFLHGEESYKFHWAADSRDLCRIRLFPPGRRGWWYQTALGVRSRAREWFRHDIGGRVMGAPVTSKG